MMPSQCVGWNCPTRRKGDETDDPTVTFHSFPLTKPDLLAQWLQNMGEANWKPQRSSVLCSRHFDRNCFLQNYAVPRLKQGAIPTFFEKRPNAHLTVDLDQRTAHENLMVGGSGGQGGVPVGRRRKVLKRYDPQEEIDNLKQMLDDERVKRRELEQELFKLRQERSEMASKMSKLEAAKCRPNIPQSLIPILVDAMTRGVDPLKKPEPARTTPATKRTAPQSAPARAPATRTAAAARAAAAAKTTTPTTTAGSPSKVVLQIPDSASKSVQFTVPVSGAASATASEAAKTGEAAAEPDIVEIPVEKETAAT
ncbi:THAP domain-containing protein 6-like [Paramacrobiotus metropolitanus]|uniref:THAP domain-containing protein 6-like n=1 Tax=Paramacrobiotus metropolitanus TaxID=2943436 RepID=UPI002445743E|nr:THAP domain-containing protein 6-like [Paramacrobiotus metropolitanus]